MVTTIEKAAVTVPTLAPTLARWMVTTTTAIGKHALHLMTEAAGARAAAIEDLRMVLRVHYVAPELAAQRLAALGAPKTAQLLREHLPTTKTARSGDLGEILATEIAEHTLKFIVPVRRLRWKDGRDMALRGDDIIGIRTDSKDKLTFLKGESKSRVALSSGVLHEAGLALDRDRGRPTRHSVLFVAERLRESGDEQLATRLEEAALASFTGSPVEHFILALIGGDPKKLLNAHLSERLKKKRRRHAVGVRITDHADFIASLFGGL